jgi:hypothetical protein
LNWRFGPRFCSSAAGICAHFAQIFGDPECSSAVEANIRSAEAKLTASGVPDARKRALRGEIDHMRRERQEAMTQARDAGRDLRQAEREVADLHYRFAPRYPDWQ